VCFYASGLTFVIGFSMVLRWTGFYKGNELAAGVYFYHVMGKGYSGKSFDLQGGQ